MTMTDSGWTLGRLQQHRHFAYRACAPHWDDPSVCAADDRVSRTVFVGGDDEPQRDRLAREATAKGLCAGCPIRAACLEYAVGDGATVRERHQVWGGTVGHERRTILAGRRRAVEEAALRPLPLGLLRTRQKQAVLAAVAGCEELGKQAAEAGLDERTTAWQISRLYTLLRVPAGQRDRQHLLDAARAAGILPEPEVMPGAVPGGAADGGEGADQQPESPRSVEIAGQLALDVGLAARPRLRIVTTRSAPRRHRSPAPWQRHAVAASSLLAFDALEAAA
jgi:WhiB family redox-sensing transcriptional regulator